MVVAEGDWLNQAGSAMELFQAQMTAARNSADRLYEEATEAADAQLLSAAPKAVDL